MQADRKRLGHGGDGGRQDGIMSEDKPGWQDDLFRKAAIADFADEAQRLANIGTARGAGRADAAPDAAIGRHAVADGKVFDTGPDCDDAAGKLVAGGRWAAADPLARAVVVKVRAADAGRFHREQDLAGAGGRRRVDRLDAQIALVVQPDRPHRFNRPS